MANEPKQNFPKGAPPGGDPVYLTPRVAPDAPETNRHQQNAERSGAPPWLWPAGLGEKLVPVTPNSPQTYDPGSK
jgi:hypothetical protein